MKSTTVNFSISEIRRLIEQEGFNWTVAQSKQQFRTHLEDQNQLDQYLNDKGNLNRSEFNDAYEASEYSDKSVQEYYHLNAKGISELRSLDAVKDAKIRRSSTKTSSNVQYNFVLTTPGSSMSNSLTDSSETEDIEHEEVEQEIPTFS